MSISAIPILDEAGQVHGARGIGVNMTGREQPLGEPNAESPGALRRWAVLDRILQKMRVEMLAPRMMQATLEQLVSATGATGAIVIDAQLLSDDSGRAAVLHEHGPSNTIVTAAAHAALCTGQPGAMPIETPAGEKLIVCPSTTRFTGSCGLALWRTAQERPWDRDDLTLIGTAAHIIRIVLEHEAIQNEMALQARVDPLTGLPNRRAFLDEAFRRVERLDRSNVPATLMFIDLDGFKRLNDHLGHDVGDAALLAATDLLRQTFRPTDIIARTGGDEFGIWLDGADGFSSAERAEALCKQAPKEMDYMSGAGNPVDFAPIGMSIGIAMRWPGGEEDLEMLVRQAEQALAAVKRDGGGAWKVYRAEVSV
jgi:diguanylate cyclase (GGDEF)-like protein